MRNQDFNEIMTHLIDIKGEVSGIKEKLADYPEVRSEVKKTSTEVIKMKSYLKALVFVFVTIPSAVAAYLRITKT